MLALFLLLAFQFQLSEVLCSCSPGVVAATAGMQIQHLESLVMEVKLHVYLHVNGLHSCNAGAHPCTTLAPCVAFMPMLQLCVGFELVHVHAAVSHKHLGKEEAQRLLVGLSCIALYFLNGE